MKKTLCYISITLLFFFVGISQISAESNYQKAAKISVDTKSKSIALTEIFGTVEKQSEFLFNYLDLDVVNVKASVHVNEGSINEVMSQALKNTNLSYVVSDRHITITNNKANVVQTPQQGINQPAKKHRVSGVVTDDFGAPVPGVSVVIKGTTIGTSTDIEGRYFIDVLDANSSILTFAFLGYHNREIAVKNQVEIDIVLSEDAHQLDEVVIVGYGVQKKETVVGAVSSVKGSDLAMSPVANLSNALIGRLAGVTVFQRSGEPGYDGGTIRIRGSNTLGNNDPLIVIDGVAARSGGLERLDPNEIESMSVLKDASAAIYGARAANGVILITTKKGKEGKKAELSYTFNYGWQSPTILPKMANSAEYAMLRNELIVNDAAVNPNSGKTPNILPPWKTDEEIQKYRDGSDPWRYPDTDWYGETFRDWSPQTIQNVTLEGGSNSVSYFATFGYKWQDAMYYNSATNYKQYNLRLNLDAEINQYMKVGVNLMGREEDRHFTTQGAGDVLWFTARGRPTDPAYWPNGLPGPAQEYGRNPVVAVTDQTGSDQDRRYYIQTNARMEITQPWISGLKFTATVSYDKYLMQRQRFFQPWYLYTWDYTTMEADGVTPKLNKALSYPNHADPDLQMYSEDQTNIVLGGIFSYDNKFGDHGINIVVGAEKDQSDNAYFDAYRRYYLSTAVKTLSAGGDKEKTNSSGGADKNWERARLNYFGRVAYDYKEKYLAEFVWREDASYMFPEDTRYGFFPGVLLGYRISEENFWKNNLSFIDYFKLRGSWGQMGNDAVWYNSALQEYQYMSTFKYAWGYIVDGEDVKGLEISRFPNKNITWERANNFDVGIEGRILDSRLNFEVDYFYNKRSNILWQRNASVPQTAGLTLPAENIGKVNNKGFDFKLDWNDKIGRDFRYNVSLTGGYSKNEIIFWDESAGAPLWQQSTGHPMSTDIYYVFDGVFKDWAEINDVKNRPNYDGVTSDKGLQPGDMKFKDLDGDGNITPDDRKRFDKNNEPKWVGGLNLFAQWKGFDVSVMFQGAADCWQKLYFDSGEIGNYRKYVFDNHWSEDNHITNHPRVHARGKYYWDSGTGANNTYWMNNTDYIRLKSMEFGYTVPQNWIKKTHFFSHARAYVSGLNMFTWTNAQELDPESTSNAGTNYPQTKVVNLGFTLTF